MFQEAYSCKLMRPDRRAVFNVAGNEYRIDVWINYPYRVVYIRSVGTDWNDDAIDA